MKREKRSVRGGGGEVGLREKGWHWRGESSMGVNRALVGVADGKGKRSFERETERGGGKSVVARVL